MTDLIVVPQAAHWQRLKRLVLDSVSSPITRRVYNLGLDEFFEWYGREPRPGFTKATVCRLARCAGGPRAWRRFHQRADHGGAQAGGRGRRQRAAGARTGQRDHAGEGRRVQGHPVGELAFREAGADAAEHAGCHHYQGAARPRDPGGAPGLRAAAVRGGGAHGRPRPAARWPVVHRGSRWEAWPRADDPDADVGEGGAGCVDRRRRRR